MILSSMILLTIVVSGIAQTQDVTVSGKVVDNNGNPVHLAHITFTDLDTSNGNTASFDTVLTKADGSFSKTIKLNSTAKILAYIVVMDGHKIKTGYKLQISSNINLDTITIDIAGPNDSLKISGTIQDNTTSKPIENAQVVLSVTSSIISLPDTVYTDASGKFSHTMAGTTEGVLQSDPKVVYVITKKDYSNIKDSLVPTSANVDLGIIKMKSTVNIIHNLISYKEAKNQPYNITLYTLQGQKIFEGTNKTFSQYQSISNLPAQYYIVEKKFKGLTVSYLEFVMKK